MNWWWLIGAALLGVAALSVYGAFQSPDFVMGLFGAMLVAGYKAIEPILAKRMTPEDEASWRAAERAGRGEEWRRRRLGLPPKG